MNGDISRSTFRRSEQFSSVRMQQGRVLLDADWNEHVDIVRQREAALLTDIIGQSGAAGSAFLLEPSHDSPDLYIHPGRFYVDGEAVELLVGESLPATPVESSDGFTRLRIDVAWLDNRALAQGDLIEVDVDGEAYRSRVHGIEEGPVVVIADAIAGVDSAENVLVRRRISYIRQPFLPDPAFVSDGEPPTIQIPQGRYLAYLETFSRTLTALERPSIREVALGGPDTTTRTQRVWQVRIASFETIQENGAGSLRCRDLPSNWRSILGDASARMRARAHPEAPAALCDMPARAGYRRLENQLYRVEIHHPSGEPGGPTFKWSRDNASMAANWIAQDGDRLEVDFAGWDRFLGFSGGAWVELTDEARELQGRPGTLVPLLTVEGDQLVIDLAMADGPTDLGSFDLNPKIRRWDGHGTVDIPAANDGWLALEEGVEIQFETGTYRTGDYWQIPARSATGDVEWRQSGGEPAFEVPAGIIRRYAPLALIEIGPENELVSIEDLRPRFKDLAQEEAGRRRRNRFIHGEGVVCGLQVRCDADRQFVRIRPGYAHAPDGAEIFLDSMRRFNVVQAARRRQYLDNDGGRVNVLVRPDLTGSPVFDIEAQSGTPESFLQRALGGTLLMDVWERCLRPALDFLNAQFRGEEDDNPRLARLSHRRQISALNLLVQLALPGQTERLFLSRAEHDVLRDLYERFRQFMSSSTFCGIDDNAPVYPEYPLSLQETGLQTAFGQGVGFMNPQRQTLMSTTRVSADGQFAATFGNGSEIYVFSPQSAELEQVIRIESADQVNDVAFYELEGQTFMLLAYRRGSASVLVRYATRNFAQVGDEVVVPNVRIMRLVPHPTNEPFMIAVSHGRGATSFHPNDFGAEELGRIEFNFNAVGHAETIADAQVGYLLATAAAGQAASESYNRVVAVALTPQGNQQQQSEVFLPGGRTGRDGFIAATFGGGGGVIIRGRPRSGARLFVVADSGGGSSAKQAFAYSSLQHASTQPAPPSIDLQTNAQVSLSFTPDTTGVLVVASDRMEVRRFGFDSTAFDDGETIPVQLIPTHVAINPNPNTPQVLVLNQLSNTLTIFPAAALASVQTFPSEELREYRREALAAYQSLVMRFLQYLKDCACGLLYRSCPPCPEVNHLSLATVTIRNGQVHHICLSARREVITMDKLFYWASAIPILPLLSTLAKDFCCAVLPELVRRGIREVDAPTAIRGSSAAQPEVTGLNVVELARSMSVADYGRITSANLTRLGMANTLLRSAATRGVAAVVSSRESTVNPADMVDQPIASVRETLSAQEVEIADVTDIGEALSTQPLTNLLQIPSIIEKGDRLHVYTRDDRVVMVTKAAEASPASEDRQKETSSTEIAELRQVIAEVRKEYGQSLAAREKEIKALRAQVDKLAKSK